MRMPSGMALAVVMLLALALPAAGQTCTLAFSGSCAPGDACADPSGQIGICNSDGKCATCTPSQSCTEVVVGGLVGCADLVPAEASVLSKSSAAAAVTGRVTTGQILAEAYNPMVIAGIAAVAALAGVAEYICMRRRDIRLRAAKLRSLHSEKKDLANTKLNYGHGKYSKLAVVVILGAALEVLTGGSATGNFLSGAYSGAGGRWIVLGLFAIAIAIYTWLCYEQHNRKKR